MQSLWHEHEKLLTLLVYFGVVMAVLFVYARTFPSIQTADRTELVWRK